LFLFFLLAFPIHILYTQFGGWASRVSLWRDSETWGNMRLVRNRKIPHCGNFESENQASNSSGQSQRSRNPPERRLFCSCLCRNPLTLGRGGCQFMFPLQVLFLCRTKQTVYFMTWLNVPGHSLSQTIQNITQKSQLFLRLLTS